MYNDATNPASKLEFCSICNEIERFEIKKKRLGENISSLIDVLNNVQVFELCEMWSKGPPVTIYSTQTIQYALLLINKYRIFSLPVLNSQDHQIGLIDVLDIVKEFIAYGGQQNHYDEEKAKTFLETKVDHLFLEQLDKKRSKSYVISRHANALSVIRNMLVQKRERFLIVDRQVAGDVEEQPYPEIFFQGIISTADILRFLCKFPSWVKREPFFQKKMRELFPNGFRVPVIVQSSEITSKVFTTMSKSNCKGVAVVDDSGKLLFNLSPSDLKGITIHNCNLLNAPCKQFMEADKTRDWWYEPIVVDLEATLYETMQTFVCTHIHHMYVVDSERKPIGKLTHRDILRQLLAFSNL